MTGAVTGRAELIRRAGERGVAVSYRNWRGREVAVSDETLAAILAALGDYRPAAAAEDRVAGAAAPWPRRRAWGFTVQLYSVRSRESWGTVTCATWPTWRPGAGASWARTSSWSTRCTRRSRWPRSAPPRTWR